MTNTDTTRDPFAPVPFKGPTKEMPCRVCSKPMTVGARTVNAPRCFDCAIKAMVQAMLDMHSKSGPTWERYINGTRAYLARIDRQ